jgi:hypothetical protein
MSFMYLFQRETPVHKDTDHFTEEEKKVSGMQLQLLRLCSDHKLTTWSRDLESLFFFLLYTPGFSHFSRKLTIYYPVHKSLCLFSVLSSFTESVAE